MGRGVPFGCGQQGARREARAPLFIVGMTAFLLALRRAVNSQSPNGGHAAWRAGVDGESAGQATMAVADNGATSLAGVHNTQRRPTSPTQVRFLGLVFDRFRPEVKHCQLCSQFR